MEKLEDILKITYNTLLQGLTDLKIMQGDNIKEMIGIGVALLIIVVLTRLKGVYTFLSPAGVFLGIAYLIIFERSKL